MGIWLAANWSSILLSLVTAGALTFCGFLWKQLKNYRSMIRTQEQEEVDEHIELKLQPIIDDMEDLRNYVRQVDKEEKHKIKLIVQSYRYRLSQLCRLFLRQGYMTFEQYDQLNEFYHLYTGRGGNGEAKALYERVIKLEILTDEQIKARKAGK